MLNKLSFSYFILGLILLMLVAPAQGGELSFTPEEQEWLASRQRIRVGFADNIEPFAIQESNGSTSGIAADMLAILSKKIGIELSLELEPWPIILAKAKNRDVDVIAGIIPKHGKAFKLDTSIQLRFNSTPTAYINNSSNIEIKSKKDLANHRIVYLKEMFYAPQFLEPLKDSITTFEANSSEEAFGMLLRNEADIFLGLNIDQYILAKRFIVNIKPAKIFWDKTFYIAMGVRDDEPLLISILQKAHSSITTAEILNIQQRWLHLPLEKPGSELSREEQDFIAHHPTIQVGIDLNYAPFEFMDKKKGHQGMSHDLLRIISQKTGLTFSSNPHWNIEALLSQVKTGKIDMLSTQIKSENSDSEFLYSDPFIRIPLVILARQGIDFVTGLDNIKKQQIGVVRGGFPEEYLKNHYPNTPLIQYQTLQDGLFGLSEGRCEFFLESLPQANHVIRTKGIVGINLVGKTKQEFDFCFAIRKDLPLLLSVINKTLATIPLNKKVQIQQKLTSLSIANQTNWRPMIQITTVALFIIIMMLIWNRRLQREIKARKSAERSFQLAQLTLDKIPLHLFWFDDTFKVVMANKAAMKTTGFKLEELQQKYAWDLDPSFNRNECQEAWDNVKFAHSVEYFGDLKCRDGLTLPTEESLTYLQPEVGQPYVVSIGADISDRKQHEHQRQENKLKLKEALIQAKESSRLKSEFLSNMSHEIRTPLNAIIGYSEMLEQGDMPLEKQRYVKTIIASGKTLIALIDDILDLSKLEAGKMQIVPIAIDPNIFFTHVINIFDSRLREKDLTHTLTLDPNLPETLLLDEVRLRQILFNLIGNAIKFTEEGTIDIGVTFSRQTTSCHGTMTITVTDTGIGIAREDQQLIFESFQQKSGGISRQYGGTGLGLTISKRFIELMNGQILLESTPGEGSCFTLVLPNIPISGTPVVPKKALPADLASLNQSTILIADDIETNRDLIKACLQNTPLTILTATNGKEAIEVARNKHLDLIFMDIKMDVMDGIEATTILKKDTETADIPIIALSGAEPDQDILELFDDFLQKPFSLKFIRQKVLQYLPSHGSQETAPPPAPMEVEQSPLVKKEQSRLGEMILMAKKTGTLTHYRAIADLLIEYGQKYSNSPLQEMGATLAANAKSGAIIEIEEQILQLENYIQEPA